MALRRRGNTGEAMGNLQQMRQRRRAVYLI